VLGVLAVAAVVTAISLAASPPPAPTISASPLNPSSSQTASFTYTDSQAITKFQCQLDGGGFSDCGTTRPSTKSYAGPLAQGSHTFQVRAVSGSNTSSATSFTWSIDSVAPTVVSINRIGASPTNASSVQWTVAFSEAVKGVDTSDFSLVKTGLGGSPAITGVTPSSSTSSASFTVTASTGSGSGTLGLDLVDNDSIVDGAGNKLGGTGAGNGSATGQVYTVDRTAPAAPTITSGPSVSPAWTTSTSVSFSFTGEAGATFQCKLDGGSFAACTSPKSYSGLAQGSHTFQVQQTDAAGNTGSAASRTFQIDSVAPPVPSITSKPANPTSSTSATFAFSDTEAGVTFLCQLDGGGFGTCTNPKPYPGPLAQGSHTFQVKARDAAGNESAAATWTWTVDTTPPNTPSITFAPFAYPPVGWSSTSATFMYSDSSSDVASYQCKLDGGSYVACASAVTYSGLAQGPHTFLVKAVDSAGNVSSGVASWTFFVDTVPPTKPVFSQTPPNPSSTATSTFAWSSTDPAPASGIVGYLCSKENGSYSPCSSPYTYTVQSTSNGEHQFSVVAVDWAGNVSQAASYKWKVDQSSQGSPFTIAGNANGLLYPGIWRNVALTITNPNNVPIYVTSITVTVTNSPNGCTNTSNIELQQSNAAPTSNELAVPANATSWPVPQSFQPQIRLKNLPSNQDNCKSQTFTLGYTGSAHS
jgi:large repetitive protein